MSVHGNNNVPLQCFTAYNILGLEQALCNQQSKKWVVAKKLATLSNVTLRHPLQVFPRSQVLEYVRFMLLKVCARDFGSRGPETYVLSPSGPVDEVWHAHLLTPHLYLRMCMAIDRRIIAHDPATANDRRKRAQRYKYTLSQYALRFGMEAPQEYWPSEAITAAVGSISRDDCRIAFFVRTLKGQVHTMHQQSGDTVLAVKHAYETQHGVPVGQQRLIYNGKQLEDGRTLASYKIVNESTVHLVLRLVGC